MPDGFVQMVDRAVGFFTELAAHNTKDWFNPRKAGYIADIRKPAELMADLMAADLSRLTGTAHQAKVMRIYRDVRFSRDKFPYNPHLHMTWKPGQPGPAFLFGVAPDYAVFGLGTFEMDAPRLAAFRVLLDRHGDDLEGALTTARAIGAGFADWDTPPLKRVPKPYAADHPHADLLRRKSITLTAPLTTGWREAGLLSTLNGMVPAFLPLRRALIAVWQLHLRDRTNGQVEGLNRTSKDATVWRVHHDDQARLCTRLADSPACNAARRRITLGGRGPRAHGGKPRTSEPDGL